MLISIWIRPGSNTKSAADPAGTRGAKRHAGFANRAGQLVIVVAGRRCDPVPLPCFTGSAGLAGVARVSS